MRKNLMLLPLAALLCLVSCHRKTEEKKEETDYTVTHPLLTDTALTKDYVAQVRSSQHIELRVQEHGYLSKIYVDEGQYVHQGQLLFQIMPKLYEAERQKAAAEVAYTQIEAQNTKTLSDKNIVSKAELALANAKLNKAKAELALQNVHLGFTQIRAPFSGYIDRLQVRLGSLVDEGALLTTLSDNSRMWVYFNVPEAEYLNYKTQGSSAKPLVRLMMANQEMFGQTGVVETIEADFDNETGNIPFRATFPNPNGLLRHGETGNVRMAVAAKNALIIPQKATYEVLDKKYVYVVDKNGIVHAREIAVRAEMEDLFVVSKGLQPSDQILLEGLRRVKDGDKIHYRTEEVHEVIAHLKASAE